MIFLMIILHGDNKKLFCLFMIITVALHIPAHYGDESFLNAYTTELSSSSFFAKYVENNHQYSYFSIFHNYVWWYGNFIDTIGNFYDVMNNRNIFNKTDYIFETAQQKNTYVYYLNDYPTYDWLQRNLDMVEPIYSNGDAKIYFSRIVKQ